MNTEELVQKFFEATKGVKVSIVKEAIEDFKNAIASNSVMVS